MSLELHSQYDVIEHRLSCITPYYYAYAHTYTHAHARKQTHTHAHKQTHIPI